MLGHLLRTGAPSRPLLALGLFAVACSSPPMLPDAGQPPDAGLLLATPDAGVPPPPSPIGGACARDVDCLSGHCDLQVAGGYCVASCTDNRSCPHGSVCEQVGHGGYCVALCTSPSDCRSGFTCPPIFDVCLPAKGCKTSADCPGQRACSAATGLCAGAISSGADIGGKCRQTSDCGQGAHPVCLTSDQNFADGYCASYCRNDADCGGHSVCVGELHLCMASCTAATDCRAPYDCTAYKGQDFCFPGCKTNNDCIGQGQTCDATSGLCSDPPAVDGGSPPDAGLELDGGTADAGAPVDGGPPVWTGGYPAPRPRSPQVVYAGGPVLVAPKLVPVFFSNDDATQAATLAAFDAELGATHYWSATTSEFGVGAASALAPVTSPDVATGTIDDASIQKWLVAQIKAQALPAPDPDTLYVLHYPMSMTIVLQGSTSCRAFGGYHSEFRLANGTRSAYAVIPRCQPQGQGTELDLETVAESHELVEASTDPFPFTAPGWAVTDTAHGYWAAALSGSELGDLCAQDPAAQVKFAELPYMVQRSWSNASVKAGRDPCVPELPGEVFFNAVPELDDALPFAYGPQPTTVLGVQVPPHGSRTIAVDLYSEADPGGPWTVDVRSGSSFMGGPGSYTYALSAPTGRNGDQLQLTITPSASASPGQADIFYVISTLGPKTHYWLGFASP